MAWVKSEYAGEFAVLSTWLVGLAPWSASVFSISGLSVVALRFLPFRLQYIFGATLQGERPFIWAWEVAGFQPPALTTAGHLGMAAFAVYALPFWLSVVYYFEEERVEAALPVDSVRLFGGLVGVVAVLELAAAALFVSRFPGTTIPVGGVLAAVLAYLLLTVDRT